jgi:hypothetical protein
MKKKMKNKESSRIEDNPKKLAFLPLSPPAHQKSPQDSHFQSSSLPVGRPPPLLMTDAQDHLVFQELEAIIGSQDGESSAPVTNPCFLTMNQEQMDFDLYDILASTEEQDESMLTLFPALPGYNNTNG